MTAQERIAEAKATRRAELAAEEARRQAEMVEQERQATENFERAIRKAFEDAGCPELADCPQVSTRESRWSSWPLREIDFDFPDCLVVTLVLINNGVASGRTDWRPAFQVTGGEAMTWLVPELEWCGSSLDDALIAAEIGEG